jgi:hypothetical protein
VLETDWGHVAGGPNRNIEATAVIERYLAELLASSTERPAVMTGRRASTSAKGFAQTANLSHALETREKYSHEGDGARSL